MATRPTKRVPEFDVIEPIGKRVVVRKDDNKRETKSGIVLPDSHEIPQGDRMFGRPAGVRRVLGLRCGRRWGRSV
jgi:hypothetical protein